eukprot:6187115-Prymnesium_polylepis.1
MQYDVDLTGAAEKTGRICYRIQVRNDVTGTTAMPLEGCLDICGTLVPFHNPAGYCPSTTSRSAERAVVADSTPHVFYYYKNNTDTERNSHGAFVRSWRPRHSGAALGPEVTDPISFGPPAITSITIGPGATWPSTAFYAEVDMYYVVISGSGVVTQLGDGSAFSSGDWAWAMAGVPHGPIVNSNKSANLTVYAIGAAALEPLGLDGGDAMPSFANPTVNAAKNRTNYCRYSGGSGLGCDYSGPHTADRVTWTGGGKAPCESLPGHPMGSCLQPHYHPHGALYIGLSGRTFYAQDFEGFDAWIDQGDVRWVRPGRWYGPEYTND